MNQRSQKIISAFLIISILAPAVLFSMPQKTSAQDGTDPDEFIPGGDPTAAEDPTAVPTIDKNAIKEAAKANALAKKRNFLQKLILGEEQSINAIKGWEKYQALLREVLRGMAREVLKKMTESTINWINSGFHGAPLFLERPESFFNDIAKSQIKNLVNIIGYNSNSFPFGKSFAINAINGYKSTFAQNAQYSLSRVINDPVFLNNYRNNFNVGGWDGFMLNTQFPSNNRIGFDITAANELAAMLSGTGDSKANIIKETLKQGQGFLSPQMCETNPNYNTPKNEFQKPTWKCPIPEPIWAVCPIDPVTYGEIGNCSVNNAIARGQRNGECKVKEIEWAKTNVCPPRANGTSGFVNTTPGSVVASQIMKAIGGPFDQTSLAAAMGNSLSAIFDALLSHFMNKGLNALSSTINGTGNDNSDDFNYDGNTFGSPGVDTTGSGGFDWNQPDEIVVLGALKKETQDAIDNANKELKLIDNSDTSNPPGFLQMFVQVLAKTRELDMCLPGPDLEWQERLETELQKSSEDLQIKMTDEDPAKVTAATAAYNGLISATNSFKDWLSNKINTELPSGASYVNAVDSIKTIHTQTTELTARKNVIMETLIKLESIKIDLGAITTQPTVGSAGEATMVRLKQRMNGMIIDISSATAVNEKQVAWAEAKSKLNNLGVLLARCNAERQTNGWTNPGGKNSTFNNSGTEQEIFCSLPIVGGYNHEPFTNNNPDTHPQIPLVNAENVYPDGSGVVDNQIDIAISCDIIMQGQ